MKIIGSKHIDWFPGFSFAYETENLFGLSIHLEYNFASKRIYDIQDFARTSSTGPYIIGTFPADLVLSCHNVDFSIIYKANNWLSVAAGPTMSFVNRLIVIDDLPMPTEEQGSSTFEDKLASFCLGLNGSLNIDIPLQTGSQYIFFFSSVKLRYMHSVWFDAQGRNLNNYYQSFFFSQLNIGIGYNF